MSNDIKPSTPEDHRRDARFQRQQRANGVLVDCDQCGTENYHTNLTSLKDGRKLCAECLNTLFDEVLGKDE